MRVSVGVERQATVDDDAVDEPDPYCHSVSVAAVIVRDDGKVLAIQRRDTGAWEPPGGVLEADEDIIDGLVREVEEEAGVVVRPQRLAGVYKYKHAGRPVVALVFLCRVTKSIWPRGRNCGEETRDRRWMTRGDVVQQMDRVFAARVLDALDEGAKPAVRSHNGRSFTWACQRWSARRMVRVVRLLIGGRRGIRHASLSLRVGVPVACAAGVLAIALLS